MTVNTSEFNSELITISQAKQYLKCSHVFLWLRRKEGKIKSVHAGRKVLIIKSSIDDFLKLNSSEGSNG